MGSESVNAQDVLIDADVSTPEVTSVAVTVSAIQGSVVSKVRLAVPEPLSAGTVPITVKLLLLVLDGGSSVVEEEFPDPPLQAAIDSERMNANPTYLKILEDLGRK